MATKDDCLSFKDKQNAFVDTPSDDQYRNLSLNQNHQCFFNETSCSKSATNESSNVQNYDVTDSQQAKNDSTSWNKTQNKNCLVTEKERQEMFDQRKDHRQEEFGKKDNLEKVNLNNSTLSLHIAAYENSIEAYPESSKKGNEKSSLTKKWKNAKQLSIDSKSVIQNPFEFPRQQEEDQGNVPYLMQFKASQLLFNPNKSVAENENYPTNSLIIKRQDAIKKRWENKQKQKSGDKLKTDAATLKRQQNLSRTKQQELEQREKDLDDRESLMNVQLGIRETEINAKFEALLAREKAVQMKEDALEQREKLLEERENQLLEEQTMDPPVTTPKRTFRGPGKILTPYSELGRTQKLKRKSEAERLGVPLAPDTASALKLITVCSIPRETVRQINTVSPNFFPSEHTYKKEKEKILSGIGWENAATIGTKSEKTISFAQSLIWRVQNIGPQYLPEVPQITIGIDSGQNSDKIGYFLNNLLNPQSDDNFLSLAISSDPEKYEYIKALFKEIFGDMYLLNDFTINGQFIIFEYFFVADLKGICTCFGHQGCSATYFCPFCYITKNRIIGPINLRTLDEIIESGKKAEAMRELYAETSKKFKDFCKENFSISRMPLIDFIPMTHVVPPPLHIKIGSINYTLKEAMKHNQEDVIKLLEDCNIKIKFPSHNLTGGDASKMLRLFAEGKVKYNGYGCKLFHLLFEIDEQFMQCRDYTDAELDIFDLIIRKIRIVIHEDYPELYSSQHLHDLVDHVPPFFRLHKSWGRYGEHSLERCHQKVRNDEPFLKSGNKYEYAHMQNIIKTSYFDKSAPI